MDICVQYISKYHMGEYFGKWPTNKPAMDEYVLLLDIEYNINLREKTSPDRRLEISPLNTYYLLILLIRFYKGFCE